MICFLRWTKWQYVSDYYCDDWEILYCWIFCYNLQLHRWTVSNCGTEHSSWHWKYGRPSEWCSDTFDNALGMFLLFSMKPHLSLHDSPSSNVEIHKKYLLFIWLPISLMSFRMTLCKQSALYWLFTMLVTVVAVFMLSFTLFP